VWFIVDAVATPESPPDEQVGNLARMVRNSVRWDDQEAVY
jgi:hypothetical protein